MGQTSESPGSGSHATLSLVSASQTWKPGQELLLAFQLDIEAGWHTYWRGISDTGQPPQFTLTLPDGFVAKDPIWPAPHREVSSAIDALDHIYEQQLTVVVPVTTPATPQTGAQPVLFKASGVWLVCKTACVPEKGEATLTLSAGDGAIAPKPAAAVQTTIARSGRPWSQAPKGTQLTHELGAQSGTCSITVPGATWLAFYPDQGCLPMPLLFKEGEAKGAALRLTLAPQDDPQATSVAGLLEVRGLGDGAQFFQVNERVKAEPAHPPKGAESEPQKE